MQVKTDRLVEETSNGRHIEIRGVSHSFVRQDARVEALHGIDLEIHRGEFVSIIGPSGCGKSTLLRITAGLIDATSGSVSIAGRPPAEMRKRKGLGLVQQDASLLPWRTVLENVRLPLEVNRQISGDATVRLLELVGLAQFRDFYPKELSGGMAQRVALARSLVHDPEVLLMDEPLGALDEITRAHMRYEVLAIWEKSRTTVIFITHSISEAVLMADRVIVMSAAPGQIAAQFPVHLPRPREESIESSPPFRTLVDQVRAALQGGRPTPLGGHLRE